jgi:protein phosphatase
MLVSGVPAPRLFVLVGVPGSGKTTFARERLNRAVRISLDDLRLMISGRTFDPRFEPQVSALGEAALDAALANARAWGLDVVFDATNVSRAWRARTLRTAERYDIPSVAVWIETPLEIARERNRRRRFPVPEGVIDRFNTNFEEPSTDEGFVEVVRVNQASPS